jgi:Putative transposase, YhgA-like
VRHVFCRPKAAAIELRRALPAEMLAEIDLESLALESSSFARPSRGPLDSDLLFTANLHGPGDPDPYSILLSLDHQSGPDDLFPFRALVYAGASWGRRVGQRPRPRRLPLMVSVLMAQHLARNIPTRLSDIIHVPDRVRDVFGAPYEARVYLDDLSASVLDDPVADPGHLALVEVTRALLYAYKNPSAHAEARLATLGPLFDTILDCFGSDEVEELLSYVFDVFGEGSPIFAIIIRTLGKAVEEVYVTMANKLRAEGRRDGIEEGRRDGIEEGRRDGIEAGRKQGRAAAKAEVLLGLLDHRTGQVPQAVRDRVLATDDEQLLQRWLDRALTAASLEAVFERLDA